MSASGGEIKLSNDGKYVLVPVAMFRSREIDLQKYDALLDAWESQHAQVEKLRNQIMVLESVIASERKAADSLTWSLKADRRKYGLWGFVIGGIAVGLIK
jgi:hypothetical protein